MIEEIEKVKMEINKNFVYIRKYTESTDTNCSCKNKTTIYEEHYICANKTYLDMLNSKDSVIQNIAINIFLNMNDVPILDNGYTKYKYIT